MKHLMNFVSKLMLIAPFIIFTQSAWSEVYQGENNFWQCRAEDSAYNKWTATNEFKRAAANMAYDACKKQSNDPKSCKTAHEFCDFYANGMITTPMWQCTALDRMAKPWVSNIYRHREDAAIAAKAYCRENSDIPDTCYVRLVGCTNLTERM